MSEISEILANAVKNNAAPANALDAARLGMACDFENAKMHVDALKDYAVELLQQLDHLDWGLTETAWIIRHARFSK